jgi:hypothetical protein
MIARAATILCCVLLATGAAAHRVWRSPTDFPNSVSAHASLEEVQQQVQHALHRRVRAMNQKLQARHALANGTHGLEETGEVGAITFNTKMAAPKASKPKHIPNVGAFIGAGYDAYFGYPLADGVDPGFRASIFEMSKYDKGRTTGDHRFVVPDGAEVKKCDACSSSFSSSVLKGTKSLQQDLAVHVGVDVEAYGGSFSASVDYEKSKSLFEKKDEIVIESKATCCAYRVLATTYDTPTLSANFRHALVELDQILAVTTKTDATERQEESFWEDFFSEFGTHITLKIEMGGRFGRRRTMTLKDVEKKAKMGLDIAVAAGYNGPTVQASVSARMGLKKDNQEQRSDEDEKIKYFSVGGKYASDKDQWMAAVHEEPMPIEIPKIKPIPWIFTPRIFPKPSSGDATRSEILEGKASPAQLVKWQAAIADSLKGYCLRVKESGKNIDCTNPSEDEISLDIDELRMSASGSVEPFGGIYSDVDNNARTSDKGCPPGYLSHDLGKSTIKGGNYDKLALVSFCWNEDATEEFFRTAKKKPLVGGLYSMSSGTTPTDVTGKNPVTNDVTCPSGYTPYNVLTMWIDSRGDQLQYHGKTKVAICLLDGGKLDPDNDKFGGMFAEMNTQRSKLEASDLTSKSKRDSRYHNKREHIRVKPNPLSDQTYEKYKYSCPAGYVGYRYTQKITANGGVVCWHETKVTSGEDPIKFDFKKR